jgi:hypothetical protein
MEVIKGLETRRNAILEEMRSIRSMKKGTINEQYFKVPLKGNEEARLQGPYYVLSRREGKKTVSERLSGTAEVEQARNDVAAYKRFSLLCREFERLTAQLGELERKPGMERQKKRHRSLSNKNGK